MRGGQAATQSELELFTAVPDRRDMSVSDHVLIPRVVMMAGEEPSKTKRIICGPQEDQI